MIRYDGSCHCGAIRFAVETPEIDSGIRCNCSICIRKGIVMSAEYVAPQNFALISGGESLASYQFGDKGLLHCFCKQCGVSVFNQVVAIPSDYSGPARPGDRRINLGCLERIDPFALPITVVDGRSF